MANASPLYWGPTATYIPPARIGGWRWGNASFSVGIGGDSNFSIFRYQPVSIGNAKLWRWGSKLCNYLKRLNNK